MLVIDASAVVDILVRSPRTPALRRLTERERLSAPHAIYAEVLSALRHKERVGELTPAEASQAVAWLKTLPLQMVWSADWIDLAWERRDWLHIADAIYVSAAERLRVPLLTTDRRLARALADRSIEVLAV